MSPRACHYQKGVEKNTEPFMSKDKQGGHVPHCWQLWPSHFCAYLHADREREREREPIESNRVVDFCSLGELETGACSTGATSAKSPCNVHNSQITSTTHILCLVIKELLFTVLFSNKIRCTTFS